MTIPFLNRSRTSTEEKRKTARVFVPKDAAAVSVGADARRRSRLRSEAPATACRVVTDLCNTLKFGSLCALGGFTPYPVMSALTHFPDDFRRPARLPQAAE